MLILATAVQFSYIVDSFPGFHSSGECSLCHNEPATAYNASYADAQITLDGLPNEEFWSESNYYNTMEMPMGNTFGGVHIFVMMKFAQNATHLFVYMDWYDNTINGTTSQRFNAADGVAILWNAHPGEYDMKEGWFSGMKTENAGESIDTWVWKANTADEGKEIESVTNATAGENTPLTGNVWDTSFDNAGWNDSGDVTQDVSAGASWGNLGSHHESNYGVEFARKLTTSDNTGSDVQFDKIGYYEFAVALYNESSGSSHIVSFEHQLYVYGDCTTDCDIPVVFTEVVTTEVEVPTTVVNNVTITDVTTSTESAPLNAWMIIVSLFSMGVLVNLISRKR
jgi:hypothetical protein